VARVAARFRPIPSSAVLESAVFPNTERLAEVIRATVGFAA
jgi:hypothetical protein